MGEDATIWNGGGQVYMVSSQGTLETHTQRWNMEFDLCTLEEVKTTGSHRSDQSGCMVKC